MDRRTFIKGTVGIVLAITVMSDSGVGTPIITVQDILYRWSDVRKDVGLLSFEQIFDLVRDLKDYDKNGGEFEDIHADNLYLFCSDQIDGRFEGFYIDIFRIFGKNASIEVVLRYHKRFAGKLLTAVQVVMSTGKILSKRGMSHDESWNVAIDTLRGGPSPVGPVGGDQV